MNYINRPYDDRLFKVVLIKDGEYRDLVRDCPSRDAAQEIVTMCGGPQEEWDDLIVEEQER